MCVCVCVSPFTESPLASASWLNSNTQNLYMQQLYSKTKHDAPRQPSLRVPSEPIDIQYIEYFDPTYTEPYANASIFRHIYYIYIYPIQNPGKPLCRPARRASSRSQPKPGHRYQERAGVSFGVYAYIWGVAVYKYMSRFQPIYIYTAVLQPIYTSILEQGCTYIGSASAVALIH